MPPAEQVELPDFETHPDYQRLFQAMILQGHEREQVTELIADVWRRTEQANARQQPNVPPQGPVQQPLPPDDNPQQQEHPEQNQPEQHPHRDHDQHPPLPNAGQNEPAADRAGKRVIQFPPVDLKAKSSTTSLQRPSTYALDKLKKGDYVPLWYFTEEGCLAAEKDKVANEDLWVGSPTGQVTRAGWRRGLPRVRAWVAKFPPARNPHLQARVGGLVQVFFL